MSLLRLISLKLSLHWRPAGSAPNQSIQVPGEVCSSHALPEILSQALGDEEVDAGELGLQRQAGLRGRTRQSLPSTKAKRGAEE